MNEKSKIMKTLKSTAITALFVIMASALIAQPGYGRKGQNFQGERGMQECRIPDLTEEQEQQIKELRAAHIDDMQEFRTDMRILREKYRDLTSGQDYNEKAASQKIDEITAIENKIMKANLEHRNEVRSMLTEEQKVYFDRRHFGKKNRGYGPGNFHQRRGYHKQGFGEGYGRSDRRCRWY